MTMWRSKEGLVQLGDHDLAERQAKILEDARRRHPGFNDFPLTGKLPQESGSRFEAINVTLSPETRKLIERMRGNGYAVYDTTGRTPASLKADGMRYWYLNPKLENITSVPDLVAFKRSPSEFSLAGSYNIPHDEQLKLLPEEQAKVDSAYPGADLVVDEGELPEWTEVALKHFKATGVRILGKDFGHNFTWTKTYRSDKPGASRARFGSWYEADGAGALLWSLGDVSPDLGLAPLVRIPRK